MTTIEQLETRNSRTVRRILRKFIDSVDILKFSFSFDRELKRFPKKYNEDIKNLVSKTYTEGYIDGGRQIRRHRPLTAAEFLDSERIPYILKSLQTNHALTAAEFKGVEDPLVTEYTEALIESLTYIAEDTKPVMIADMTAWYEAGWSYARISKGMQSYFDENPTSANRMARTMTNDIFNRATERRYEDSGVVDGLIYAAHLDERTSEICRMLNGTIWALGDSEIRRPPQHFNCRSRLRPYFGTVPGKRDYTKDFSPKFIDEAEHTAEVFKTKYWNVK